MKGLKEGMVITYPGNLIKLELKARGITQKDFAKRVGVQPSHLSEILRGTRGISDQFADSVETELGIPSSHLKHMQAEYDYKKKTAFINDRDQHEAEVVLNEYNEIYDMRMIYKALGLVDCTSVEKLRFCHEVLNFKTPSVQKQCLCGYFHKSTKTGLDARMISTWTVLAHYESERQQLPTGRFNKESMDSLSRDLAEIFNENSNTINKVTRKLSEYGIKFCIVPKVDRASIDGYSFISNGQPSIVVTKRYNRIDNFAFAVLHEVGHLKYHINEGEFRVTVADADELGTKEEREANRYAADALIPETIWKTAPEVPMNPHTIQLKYSAWAKRNRLNKWIVLGRVSHDTGMYMFKTDDSREIQ